MKCLGMLCVISAPSGTGKSTLIDNLVKSTDFFCFKIKLSISYTTRVKRIGEIDGSDYNFISVDRFKYMIKNNMFIEYAEVFNNFYGTAKKEIISMMNSGIHVILNINWNGAQQIRNKISNVYTIFILPPSKKDLISRLYSRSKNKNPEILNRMKQVVTEINHYLEYDYIIINDNFNVALTYLKSVILSEQLRLVHQKKRCKRLIDQFFNKIS